MRPHRYPLTWYYNHISPSNFIRLCSPYLEVKKSVTLPYENIIITVDKKANTAKSSDKTTDTTEYLYQKYTRIIIFLLQPRIDAHKNDMCFTITQKPTKGNCWSRERKFTYETKRMIKLRIDKKQTSFMCTHQNKRDILIF